MRRRRLPLLLLLLGLCLVGIGWVLLAAAWRWSLLGGWDADDPMRMA